MNTQIKKLEKKNSNAIANIAPLVHFQKIHIMNILKQKNIKRQFKEAINLQLLDRLG